MLARKYAAAVRDTVTKIESTQMPNIERAAEAIANSLANRGSFWVYGIGHGGDAELTGRAGGLMATGQLALHLGTESPVAESPENRAGDAADVDLEAVRLAVKSSDMRSGDVLMLASVSGRNREPIELALAARELGATVIAMTSLKYSSLVESLHPSGRKLCDVADVVVDNYAPFGDACIEIEGYSHRVLPMSGVAQVTIGWMICGEAIEKLQAMGKPPHIYMSQNRPEGPDYNAAALEEYNKVGY